jgi:hypothetical protein
MPQVRLIVNTAPRQCDARQGFFGTDVKVRAYVSIRQHTSAYVSIRQHTSAYVSVMLGRAFFGADVKVMCVDLEDDPGPRK